jgi:hypothetical protein
LAIRRRDVALTLVVFFMKRSVAEKGARVGGE